MAASHSLRRAHWQKTRCVGAKTGDCDERTCCGEGSMDGTRFVHGVGVCAVC